MSSPVHEPAVRSARAKHTSLRRRLARALQVAAVVLVLLLAGTGTALAMLAERQTEIVDVYYVAISQGDTDYLALVDAEAAVRAFATTGDDVTLDRYRRLSSGSRDHRPAEVRDLDAGELMAQRLGADHPAIAERDDALVAARDWMDAFAEPVVARVAAGGPDAVTAADVRQGRVLFADVRAEAEEYLDILRDGRHEAVEDLRLWRTVLVVMLLLLAAAAVATGVLLWVFLRRWVTDPLARLAADARMVAEGDLDHVVVDSGPGEVGEVARDVEQMRSQLARVVAVATAARAEVEASHARLQDQAEDLRRSNRDLEQFAYVASHDLQEPLRKVASFTQLLAKRYEGQLDERADQYIGFAVDGAKRMQRLINDLLSFSRVGRIGGEVTDVDLRAALAHVTNVLEEPIVATGAEVVGEELPVVPGEGPLLTQLLQNLVGNALKFRHPDRSPVVRLSATRVGDCWELACADNGIGIDPQYAERVFVIFQRLHAKDVYEGTGIGLALCKKIVEYHGGHIWIDTAVTEGTTIRWTLPVEPQAHTRRGEDDPVATALEPATAGTRKE